VTSTPSTPHPPQQGKYDTAPGVIAIPRDTIPTLPDDLGTRPDAGRLDPCAWFKNPALPLEIEIGCGKGTFILNESKTRPNSNFLGIEWEGEFFAYSCDRLRRAGVTNARVLHADATEFLRWRTPSALITVIHLYFSDPWPKAKHHKNRVIQHRFLAEAWRVLAPGGELRVVTDHDDLWAWCSEHFATWTNADSFAGLRAAGTIPASALPNVPKPFELLPFATLDRMSEGEVVGTNYERKMCVGKTPHSCTLRKVSP